MLTECIELKYLPPTGRVGDLRTHRKGIVSLPEIGGPTFIPAVRSYHSMHSKHDTASASREPSPGVVETYTGVDIILGL
jgi:hypothetical protein